MDTGASCCTLPSLQDFEPDTLKVLPSPQTMKGIGGNIEICQLGVLKFKTIDDNGLPFIIRCPRFYTPMLVTRLFSPKLFLATGEKGGCNCAIRLKNCQTLTMPLNPSSKLFYANCLQYVQKQAAALANSLGLVHDPNRNLSRGQKSLLRWHHALVHVGFSTIRPIEKLG